MIVYVVGFTEPPGDRSRRDDRAEGPQVRARSRRGHRRRKASAFPNGDPFLHNVFSQSTARKFDLGSFKKGETKDKEFPNAGVVDVYCNIHPEMAATILVLPNNRHTRAAADGSFVIDGVPAGHVDGVRVHAPRGRSPVERAR